VESSRDNAGSVPGSDIFFNGFKEGIKETFAHPLDTFNKWGQLPTPHKVAFVVVTAIVAAIVLLTIKAVCTAVSALLLPVAILFIVLIIFHAFGAIDLKDLKNEFSNSFIAIAIKNLLSKHSLGA
jgi:hypothetical protein